MRIVAGLSDYCASTRLLGIILKDLRTFVILAYVRGYTKVFKSIRCSVALFRRDVITVLLNILACQWVCRWFAVVFWFMTPSNPLRGTKVSLKICGSFDFK